MFIFPDELQNSFTIRKKVGAFYQVQIGHLPRALQRTEQQRHLPAASMDIEPYAAIAVDLQQPLREFRWSEALRAPGNLVGQVFR